MTDIKKRFSDSRGYPVVFMLIATIIFIGILATFYQLTLDKVKKHQELNYKLSIAGLFDLPKENILETFDKNFISVTSNDLEYYKAIKNGDEIGFVFDISGSGLWGTINAIIAVTPDFSKIIGIEILSQNETPGLGGRITEAWFKDQFKNKNLIVDNKIKTFKLVPEGESTSDIQVNQITGATSSSKAVVNIIKEEMLKKTKKLGLSYE